MRLFLFCGLFLCARSQSMVDVVSDIPANNEINDIEGEIAQKLCDEKPPSSTSDPASNEDASDDDTPSELPLSARKSKYNNGGPYNAKHSMENRFNVLRSVCALYSDKMRPESHSVVQHTPGKDNFVFHPQEITTGGGLAFCPIQNVEDKAMTALFRRLHTSDEELGKKYIAFFNQFPKSLGYNKRAILVRHPMERLIEAYRHEFAEHYNAATGQVEGGQLSFSDFIELVVNGARQLAEMEMENGDGGSLGIDTGIIDGEGQSKAWNSYWRQCGICHRDFMPHYIMHMETLEDDARVLLDILGNPKEGHKWNEVERENKVGNPEVIKYFYSQLTKDEIRNIYDKYRVDFELFGYKPDYFLQFGRGE